MYYEKFTIIHHHLDFILITNIHVQTFTKITSGDIVGDSGRHMGSARIDFNRDGFFNLAVVKDNGQNDGLYQNNNDGTFKQGHVIK